VGSVKRGRLRSSVPVPGGEHLRIKPSSEDETYGTYELVHAVTLAAERVGTAYPGARLTVGDLSRRSGGRLRPHRSHRRGLDVDLG
jgi:penicillin-insensitive murein endopeptidase